MNKFTMFSDRSISFGCVFLYKYSKIILFMMQGIPPPVVDTGV